MSETICNPQTLLYNGAPVSDANPLPCSSASATQAAISTALLNPVTWLINGALVSDTNPIPITLVGGPSPSLTTWSPTNKSIHAGLTNSNLTATGDGDGSDFSGQATTGIGATDRVYFELAADTVVTTHPVFGLGDASQNFGTYLGQNPDSIGYQPDGSVFFNNGLVTTLGTFGAAAVVGIAVDRNSGKWWATLNGTTWNNDILANQNPAVGSQVGGIAVSVAGTLFPAYGLLGAAATTARFSSSSWSFAATHRLHRLTMR